MATTAVEVSSIMATTKGQQFSSFHIEVLAVDPICADFRLKGINFFQLKNWNICCNNKRFLEPVQQCQGCWSGRPVNTPEDFPQGTHLLNKGYFRRHGTEVPMSKKAERNQSHSLYVFSIPYNRLLPAEAQSGGFASPAFSLCVSFT